MVCEISGLRRHAAIAIVAIALLASAILCCSDAAWSVTFQEIQVIEARYNELYAAHKYREAVPVAEQMADSVKKLFGTKHPNYAQVRQTLAHAYNNAGVASQADGAFADAEKHYRRALAVREQVYPANHPETAQSYDNIGTVSYHQGRYQDA